MPVTPEALYEQTLVVRSQIGDEAAFQELLMLYVPRLLLFTQRMMQSSPEQIADVAQETWIAIYRALPRLLDASKFRPWAFRIARDRIYREYRRRKLPMQPMKLLAWFFSLSEFLLVLRPKSWQIRRADGHRSRNVPACKVIGLIVLMIGASQSSPLPAESPTD
jgi:DNA-directed RNA polymerase specialized sigma24 family protein